jgi:TolB-like protein
MQRIRLLLASLLVCSVTACSQIPDGNADLVRAANASTALGNIELHTFQLANELFANISTNGQSRYAVVGFVPVDTMVYSEKMQHPLMLLGHQLEQGMITEASRRGMITREFKLSSDIMINERSDRILSRDIDKLSSLDSIDFYITGTLVYQQEGAIVNARVVNARNKDVVAAATRFFPAELFWQREQITNRNGKIYRTGVEL